MRHARPDYERIQDPANLIPADEPVFLLRASDMLAPNLVIAWATQARANGVDIEMVNSARQHAEAMAEWQRTHGRKVPDMPQASKQTKGDMIVASRAPANWSVVLQAAGVTWEAHESYGSDGRMLLRNAKSIGMPLPGWVSWGA